MSDEKLLQFPKETGN